MVNFNDTWNRKTSGILQFKTCYVNNCPNVLHRYLGIDYCKVVIIVNHMVNMYEPLF